MMAYDGHCWFHNVYDGLWRSLSVYVASMLSTNSLVTSSLNSSDKQRTKLSTMSWPLIPEDRLSRAHWFRRSRHVVSVISKPFPHVPVGDGDKGRPWTCWCLWPWIFINSMARVASISGVLYLAPFSPSKWALNDKNLLLFSNSTLFTSDLCRLRHNKGLFINFFRVFWTPPPPPLCHLTSSFGSPPPTPYLNDVIYEWDCLYIIYKPSAST